MAINIGDTDENADWIKQLPGHKDEVKITETIMKPGEEKAEHIDKMRAWFQGFAPIVTAPETVIKGGDHSGHHGHQGILGSVGGSLPSSGVGAFMSTYQGERDFTFQQIDSGRWDEKKARTELEEAEKEAAEIAKTAQRALKERRQVLDAIKNKSGMMWDAMSRKGDTPADTARRLHKMAQSYEKSVRTMTQQVQELRGIAAGIKQALGKKAPKAPSGEFKKGAFVTDGLVRGRVVGRGSAGRVSGYRVDIGGGRTTFIPDGQIQEI